MLIVLCKGPRWLAGNYLGTDTTINTYEASIEGLADLISEKPSECFGARVVSEPTQALAFHEIECAEKLLDFPTMQFVKGSVCDILGKNSM